jgi:hypothetical protein
MGLQGPVRFSAVKRINDIESVSVDDAKRDLQPAEWLVEGAGLAKAQSLTEGGKP